MNTSYHKKGGRS